jgi:hypothetical protein
MLWLAERIVRAIEPDDPIERDRYWRRGGFFTAPFRWLWWAVAPEPRAGRGLVLPEQRGDGSPADPPGGGGGRDGDVP